MSVKHQSRWNYSNPGAKVWTDEYFDGNYHPGTTTYDSAIYYVVFWGKGTGGLQSIDVTLPDN